MMQITDQGMSLDRYTVMPRTLIFLTRGCEVLLLRGAPHKTLWAGLLNGVGGHLEPGEDVLRSACREVQEETGLLTPDLVLRGLVHVEGQPGRPGVLLFVYVGQAPAGPLAPSAEGSLEWHTIEALPRDELVEDLPDLLPRLLTPAGPGQLVYGHYGARPGGVLSFRLGAP